VSAAFTHFKLTLRALGWFGVFVCHGQADEEAEEEEARALAEEEEDEEAVDEEEDEEVRAHCHAMGCGEELSGSCV
jgi:hypothetical protein